MRRQEPPYISFIRSASAALAISVLIFSATTRAGRGHHQPVGARGRT